MSRAISSSSADSPHPHRRSETTELEGRHPLASFTDDPGLRIMFDAIATAGSEIGLVLLDADLRLLWMNDTHRKVLKDWTNREFEQVVGEQCFRVWNQFDKACSWCPVTKCLNDGRLYRGSSASPGRGPRSTLNYSEIVALPLATGKSTQLVLELVFPHPHDQPYEMLRSCAEIGEQLGGLLHDTNDSQLFLDLVALFLFAAVAGVTRVQGFFYELQASGSDVPIVSEHRQMVRKHVQEDLNQAFLARLSAHPEDMTGLWARFCSQSDEPQVLLSALVEPEIFPFLPHSDWIPTRISANACAFRIPYHTQDASKVGRWLILAENTESNTFLLRDSRTNLSTFVSAVRRHSEMLDQRRRETALVTETKKKLDLLGHPEIVDAVPFSLGLGHDLGHLTNRIASELHLLRHLDLPPQVAQRLKPHLSSIKGAVDSVSHIRNSLRTFSTLKTPKFARVNITEVLDRTLEYAVDVSKRPGISIQTPYKCVEPLTVDADRTLLGQVFFNLIDNASKELMLVRYRIPTLTISLRRSSDSFAEVEFHDNGYGIEDQDLLHIFDRYFSRTGGTGLGLYYSMAIIEQVHHGQIEVHTHVGDGSSFVVRLPIR